MLDHASGLGQDLCMSVPKYWPWLVPFLNTKDQELDRPEDGPGAMGEVAGGGEDSQYSD